MKACDDSLTQGNLSRMAPCNNGGARSLRTIYFLVSLGLIVGTFFTSLFAAPPAPLGASEFQPSPEQPVGWRGDGSGRYPGANGPLAWERKPAADGYSTKGIVWMAPLPNIGVACPIIVGDRIFLTSEICDLVCLDKQSGR